MSTYKYSIGQKVLMKSYNPWIGEYTAPVIIAGFGNVFLNGVPTYSITIGGEMWDEISEALLEKEQQ